MTDATVRIRLERDAYQPGEELMGAFALEADDEAELESLELSVLWHTEGKGDEDLGVMHYEEWSDQGERPFDRGRPHAFTARLPRTPHSYDGVLLKIHWCVRVRARWAGGGESLEEAPFTLGQFHHSPTGQP
jgi:hypothetical protein